MDRGTATTSSPRILISGAGVAGTVLGYWLSRAGISSTIVERSPSLRTAGQTIDIRGAGLTVVQKMGLEATIRLGTTHEAGVAYIDASGNKIAEFPVEAGGRSFTSDIEILRVDLVKIFYDKTLEQGGVEYIFGDYVTGLEEEDGILSVAFSSSADRKFDIIVGADGQGSKTRDLVFPPEEGCVKSLGMYISYFSIPYDERDGTFSQWYNAPGGRSILLRPDGKGNSRAYLFHMSEVCKSVDKVDVQKQKEMWRSIFADAGWEAKRILDGMDRAEDFYMQSIVQIKLASYHQGRVVLAGDAGYCASPLSGMGTSLAIVGAYVLAGSIAQNRNDYEAAFMQYEETMKPYVAKAQTLNLGVPRLTHPQTWWGISILHGVFWFVTKSGLATLFGKLTSPPADAIVLPEYDFEEQSR